MPESARVLADRYRLIRPLGQGAMGSLWIAEHLALRSFVAIKLIRDTLIADADAAARFLREARAAAALRSPHVVQILDHGVHEGTPYIAMELLEGETLAERLTRQGTLSAAETGTILTHVSRALSRAHAHGIIHRDLKPSNIFVVSNDDELLGKVFDFGLAKSLDPSDSLAGQLTASGLILGTPYYMSPEQADGSSEVGVSTDIWAMGVVAYECLVGEVPFKDSSLRALVLAICTRPLPIPSLRSSVPAGFDAWFAQACNRDPKLRYSSAKLAALEFQRLVLGQAVPAALQEAAGSEGEPNEPVALDAANALQLGVESVAGAQTSVPAPSAAIVPWRPRGAFFAFLGAVALGVFILARYSVKDSARPTATSAARTESNLPSAAPVQSVPPLTVTAADSGPPRVSVAPIGSVAALATADGTDATPSPPSSARAPSAPSRRKATARTPSAPARPSIRPAPQPAPPSAGTVTKKRRVDLGI